VAQNRAKRRAAATPTLATDGAPGLRLVVGLVRGLHGLGGAVRVEILSDDERRFARGRRVYLEGEAEALTITWSQADGPGILVRFREIGDREAAEGLRERYLEAEVVPDALPPGSFYWHEVQGTEVRTTEGEVLGLVEEIFRVGEGEVFIVRGGQRGEILVPAVSAVVRELSPRDGRIVVDKEALGLDDEAPRPKLRGRLTTRARRRQERAAGAGPEGASDPGLDPEPMDEAERGAASAPGEGEASGRAEPS
jgi:16S rRNA processing protein RimM